MIHCGSLFAFSKTEIASVLTHINQHKNSLDVSYFMIPPSAGLIDKFALFHILYITEESGYLSSFKVTAGT
jgi:hypothetical protein